MHEAGAVKGLDALSDTAIGTGLPLVVTRLVSLPEEKTVGADRFKAKAFIESQWSSSILVRVGVRLSLLPDPFMFPGLASHLP